MNLIFCLISYSVILFKVLGLFLFQFGNALEMIALIEEQRCQILACYRLLR